MKRLGAEPLTHTEKCRRVRAKRRAQGLCWYCTKRVAPGSNGQCEDHLEYSRVQSRQQPHGGKWQPGSVGRPPLWAKAAGLVGKPATAQTEAA